MRVKGSAVKVCIDSLWINFCYLLIKKNTILIWWWMEVEKLLKFLAHIQQIRWCIFIQFLYIQYLYIYIYIQNIFRATVSPEGLPTLFLERTIWNILHALFFSCFLAFLAYSVKDRRYFLRNLQPREKEWKTFSGDKQNLAICAALTFDDTPAKPIRIFRILMNYKLKTVSFKAFAE